MVHRLEVIAVLSTLFALDSSQYLQIDRYTIELIVLASHRELGGVGAMLCSAVVALFTVALCLLRVPGVEEFNLNPRALFCLNVCKLFSC